MYLNMKVKELTQEDLVNLLSTALYGNNGWYCDYVKEDYETLCIPDKTDCYEDKLAKILLGGGSIEISDRYAEDKNDHYSKLSHAWDAEHACMTYCVTLEDVYRGLDKAAKKGYQDRVSNLANDPAQLDMFDADLLLQYIVYGDYIYG